MSALILYTCLIAVGDCRHHVAADALVHGECMVQSQRVAAQYATEHPQCKVARVICTDRRRIDFYLGRGQA